MGDSDVFQQGFAEKKLMDNSDRYDVIDQVDCSRPSTKFVMTVMYWSSQCMTNVNISCFGVDRKYTELLMR
jgi:hypothetical protein